MFKIIIWHFLEKFLKNVNQYLLLFKTADLYSFFLKNIHYSRALVFLEKWKAYIREIFFENITIQIFLSKDPICIHGTFNNKKVEN